MTAMDYALKMMLVLLACLGSPTPTDTGALPATTMATCPSDDRSSCCIASDASLTLCADLPIGNRTGVGTFSATSDGWLFTPDGQDPWEIYQYVRGAPPALPDLAALGTVAVDAAGGCGWDGEGSPLGGAFWIESSGDLTVVVGTGPVDDPRLSVHFEAASTCLAREGDSCSTALRSRALVFERDGESVMLLPGEEADLGPLHLHALRASENIGQSTCDDVQGGAFNWLALAR